MPRDQRLYMTFPIDFDEHPKVEGLSDAAFRAFVSMNGYSRRHGLDGQIPAATARRRWKPRVLAELVASHPERPLVLLEADVYVIRDYAEHQLTTADIEDLRKKRSEAGSKGGRARVTNEASASTASKQMLEQTGSKVQAESESESEIDITHLSRSGTGSNARDAMPDRIQLAHDRAEALGIRDLASVREMLERAAGEPVSLLGAVELVRTVLSSAVSRVRDVDAYVATACRNSAAEIQRAYFDLDVEGAA